MFVTTLQRIGGAFRILWRDALPITALMLGHFALGVVETIMAGRLELDAFVAVGFAAFVGWFFFVSTSRVSATYPAAAAAPATIAACAHRVTSAWSPLPMPRPTRIAPASEIPMCSAIVMPTTAAPTWCAASATPPMRLAKICMLAWPLAGVFLHDPAARATAAGLIPVVGLYQAANAESISSCAHTGAINTTRLLDQGARR